MKKLIILAILTLGLTGCFNKTSNKLGADYREVFITKDLVGSSYSLEYVNDTTGKIETFTVTKAEYDDVANNNKQPPKKGYTFYGGGGRPIYEEKIPVLKDNEYYVVSGSVASNTQMIVIKKDGVESLINKTDLK